jgi:hypothetical protein
MLKLTQGCVVLSFLSVMACSGQNLAKDDPSNPNQPANVVSLERDYQEVIHYDCNHNITSDGIETVKSPTQWVTINPTNPTNVSGSSFLNTSTNSTAGLISANTNFQVDYSFGTFTMHVVSGLNVISYKFYTCSQWTGSACTAATTMSEQGTVTLNVSYIEKNLTQPQAITDCPPPPSTTTPMKN